jgi:hypothetical protein
MQAQGLRTDSELLGQDYCAHLEWGDGGVR